MPRRGQVVIRPPAPFGQIVLAPDRRAVSLGGNSSLPEKRVLLAEPESRTPAHAQVLRNPWVPPAVACALAVPALAFVLGTAGQPLEVLPLIGICLVFMVTESVPLHFEFRKQTFSWPANELAIILALHEVGGAWSIVARLIAVTTVLVVQRYPAYKLAFNVAIAVIEIAVAVAVLSVLPVDGTASPVTWLSYLIAMVTSDVVGALLIAMAITLAQGYPGRHLWATLLVPIVIVAPMSVIVGLAAVLLLHQTLWAWLLIVPIVGVLGLLYRRFGAVTREGDTLERVYDFARRVEQIPSDEDGARQLVFAVRDLLNAEKVALWLPPYLDEEPRLVVAAEDGAVWYDGPGDPDDVFRRRAVDAAADGPVHASLARADDVEVTALGRRGASDLIGAAIVTAAGEPGYLEVCDRRSDVVTFAEGDRAALESVLTHVNAAIRQQQLLTQIRYDADHDRLTGLPNRQRLAAEIDALLAADPVAARVGLILAALDNYTEVTDTLGHAASDELLLVTAGLLR